MEAKKKVGLLAILCLAGTSFAWGGFGMDFGWGNLFGMGDGHDGGQQGIGAAQNVSVETRAEFMQATHEGDYDTALKLHEEYGLGGKKMEFATPEILQLTADIFNAQTLGNWVEAVVLQDKLRELVAETAQTAMEERKEMCDAALAENADQIADLQEQIKAAVDSGDEETAAGLKEQMKELVPEGCGMGMGIKDGKPPQMNDTCKAAIDGNREEIASIREQLKAAKEAGDNETIDELKAQLEALIPEECAGKGPEMGQRGDRMPPEVSETCKLAIEENKDTLAGIREQMKAAKEAGDEATAQELKAQMDALIPDDCPKGPRGDKMHGEEMEPPMPEENVD